MKEHSQAQPLSITIDPGTVYVSPNQNYGSYANLTVTIQNISSASVNVTGIAITLPDALAPANFLNSVVPVAGQPNLWSFGLSEFNVGEFDAASQSGNPVPLSDNGKWQFSLQGITLATVITQQSVNVTALVEFADGTSQTQLLAVNMDPATAGITYFNSQPSTIDPGQTSVLNWECTGINYVIIDGVDDTHRKPSDTVNVSPNSTTLYTLYAYGDGVILSTQTGITVGNAEIISFGGEDGVSSINCMGNITLVWKCNVFTESISLTDDTGVTVPENLLTNGNTLQNGSVMVGPIVKPTTFTFTAYGNTKANYDQSEPTIYMNDVSYSLTANPSNGAWEKDNVTLNWNITSASAVSIDPAVNNGPSLDNLSGSAIINPEANITYTLSVSGFTNNEPAQYQKGLPVNVQQVEITSFTQTPAQLSPGTGNVCQIEWETVAQVVSVNGTSMNTNSSEWLTAPPNGAVYTLTAGTFLNPNILTQSLVIANSYGPYTFNSFQPDQTCIKGLDLMVTDPEQMQYLEQGIQGGYVAVLTGVNITSNPVPTQLVAFSNYQAGSATQNFVVIIFPQTDEALTLEWADINKPTGTITLQPPTDGHLAVRAAFSRLKRLRAGKI